MDSLKLLVNVTIIAVVLGIIGIIGMLVDIYGNYVHTLLSRIMDRDNKSLGRRVEELDDEFAPVVIAEPEDFTEEDYNDLPPICGTPDVVELDEKIMAMKNAKIDPEPQDEFGDMDFLGDKFKEGDQKVESGEISCNLDNPEDCINCGS